MSRSSPCCGARPCFWTNRWMSSNPAMMRSSRGGRPPDFSGGANSSSSALSSSRSTSLIATLFLEAHEGCGALGHPLFPSVGGCDRGNPVSLPLEANGAHRKLLGFFRRQARPLGGDRGRDLFEAFLAHRLGENRVCLAERIDPVDEIDVEVAHVHRIFAHAVDESGVGALLLAASAPTAVGYLLRLLGE